MKNSLKGHIALLTVQIIYALNYSIVKGLMPEYIGPMAIVFCRITGSCLLFWLLSLFVKTQPVAKKDMLTMLWVAIFGMAVNQIFFIGGLNRTTPINSAIIMIFTPVMVFIFSMLFYKERVTVLKVSGLILAIAGAVMILSYRGNFELGSETLVGDLMSLVNSASWAIFVVTAKPITQKYNTVTSMRWMFLFGSFYVAPVTLGETLQTNWHAFTPHAAYAIVFVVVATTFLAYLLNIYGLQELSPNTVSAYIYLQPFLASLFAIISGKDVMTTTKLISGILIIFGLYLVNIKSKNLQHD